jgi:hypothetical protein
MSGDDQVVYDLTEEEVRDSLCDLLKKHHGEPGVLGVLIERQRGMLVAAFTYNLLTVMKPSNEALETALLQLQDLPMFQGREFRQQFSHTEYLACKIDTANRQQAGDKLVQAILSSAAGLSSITYSDADGLEDDMRKQLHAMRRMQSTMELTNTVHAEMGSVSGIDKIVMDKFDFQSDLFENDILTDVSTKIPSLHMRPTLNKIAVFDVKNGKDVFVKTYYTTTEVKLRSFGW